MGRDDGFAIADVSTVHFDDPKVRRLWRDLDQVDAMCRATTIHFAVVLASWREGHRVTVEEALPLWLRADPEILAALVSAKLLDRSLRIPVRTWNRWYGPAFARREERREAGRRGGLRKAEKRSSSGARAELYPAGPTGPAVPSVPSVPTGPSSPGARARGGAAPGTLRDAIAAAPGGPELLERMRR